MDKNFRVRTLCGFGLAAVAIASLFTLDGIIFKVLFGIFALVSAIELISFFNNRKLSKNKKARTRKARHFILAAAEIIFLICGTIYIAQLDVMRIWLLIFGVCSYDVFAYMFGKAFGGKIFKKSRPFPHISKNKTWEGTALGILASELLVILLLVVLGRTDYIYLLCAPLALMGDLFESYLKRQFMIKDSNEIVIRYKFFEKLELIVGGTEGHGGFLDRLDSITFASTILLVISLVAWGNLG